MESKPATQGVQEIDLDVILSAIAEGSSDAITRVDIDGRILSWSAGAERIFGYTHDEIVGQSLDALLPPDIREREHERIVQQITGGMGLIHEQTVRCRKSGEMFPVQMTRLPLKNSEGKTIALLAVLKDISESEKLKKRLESLERNTAMAKVAAKVAHEIRTPLGVLFLKSDLLVERLNLLFHEWGKGEVCRHKEAIEKYVADIQKQVSRLEEIANNYLHLSKSRVMEKEEVNLKAFLHDVSVECKEQYKEDHIHWEFEVQDPLPPVSLDPQQFHRVISNLVRNSIEAVRSMEPRDKIIGLRVNVEDDRAEFVIWDNGPGMPNDIKQTVFDPFTTTKSIGTGLGLYLVQEIVQNHGGEIAIDSTVGEGTSVRISIPAR